MTALPAYELAMFPLEQTLLPTALVPLHVFEPRYRALARDVTTAAEPEFGVTMIERGREVGGGDHRAGLGVVARVLDHQEYDDGRWGLVAGATRRIRVMEWLEDDPYPRARVEDYPDTDADTYLDVLGGDGFAPVHDAVERLVRVARRLEPDREIPAVELPDDPAVATWQAATLAQLGPLDAYELLAVPDAVSRAGRTAELLADRAEVLEALADEGG